MRYLKKISHIIFVCLLAFLAGCAKDKESDPFSHDRLNYNAHSLEPLVVFILDPKNEASTRAFMEVSQTLNYTKIPYTALDLEEHNRNALLKPSTKVVVLTEAGGLSEKAMQGLLQFISTGGTVFFPAVNGDPGTLFLAGVRGNITPEYDYTARGYKFVNHFLPGLKQVPFFKDEPLHGLKKEAFKDNVEVLSVASNDSGYATILRNRIGTGSVVLFNTDQPPKKKFRGIYFAAILSGLPNIPYPVANVSSIFLDDFPSPVYDVLREPIKSEFSITQAQFNQLWWEDMLELAREENLEYSSYVCFDYRRDTHPPFLFPEWNAVELEEADMPVTDWFIKDIKEKDEQELGFHGYNHVPLQAGRWPNKQFMVLALRTVEKKWRTSRYGKLPETYVPPTNLIDSLGFVALREGMPSINVNSSVYFGEFLEGGDREFEPEPYDRHFFNYPRITSGYVLKNSDKFLHQSVYLFTGIWTHFLHPDDVFLPIPPNEDAGGRNIDKLGWRTSENGQPGMLPVFRDYLKSTKALFPMSRFLKVKDAAEVVKEWRFRKYYHSHLGEEYTVSSEIPGDGPNFWFAYIPADNEKDVEHYLRENEINFTRTALMDGSLFNIRTEEGTLSIPQPGTRIFSDQGGLLAYREYLDFTAAMEISRDSMQQETIQERINSLVTTIKQADEVNIENWEQLFTYLGWEDRQEEIWSLLEEEYQKNQSQELVQLSRQFVSNSDYPNDLIRRRWMLRQIEKEPEALALRAEYLLYFGEGEEVELSTQELFQLYQNEQTPERKTTFMSLLLRQDPDEIAGDLDGLEACSQPFHEKIARDISWFYANRENYEAALEWAACATSIPQNIVLEWRINTGEYDFLREENFSRYISYLLQNQPEKVPAELIETEGCPEELEPMYASIAYTYSNQGSYRKALQWAECAEDFPIRDQLYWYRELGSFVAMEEKFREYMLENPEDHELKAYMAEQYLYNDDFRKGWELAASLPPSEERERLQALFNTEIRNLSPEGQRFFLKQESDFLYPTVAAIIRRQLRMESGRFLEWRTAVVAQRLDPTSLGNKFSYTFKDVSEINHSLGITHYTAYELNLQETHPANIRNELVGLEYVFSTSPSRRTGFTGRARVERNQFNSWFYQLSATASHSSDYLYSSAIVSHQPAITGAAYTLTLYRSQLTIYEELNLPQNLHAVVNLEGNYFSDGFYNLISVLRAGYRFSFRNSQLLPYIEGSAMTGDKDSPGGYPYWTLSERYYGGIGINYRYSRADSPLQINLDAAAFVDTFSDNFQRYRGEVTFPLSAYFHVNTAAEFYTIRNFYSNNFLLGLKYFLD